MATPLDVAAAFGRAAANNNPSVAEALCDPVAWADPRLESIQRFFGRACNPMFGFVIVPQNTIAGADNNRTAVRIALQQAGETVSEGWLLGAGSPWHIHAYVKSEDDVFAFLHPPDTKSRGPSCPHD